MASMGMHLRGRRGESGEYIGPASCRARPARARRARARAGTLAARRAMTDRRLAIRSRTVAPGSIAGAAILPLLVAEFVVWLGFGGLLPVLPLYFTEQGIDLATLGLVIAAWPAARLVSEPIFGWLADRTARVPLMVIGLVATGVVRRPAAGPHRAGRVHPAARRRRARGRHLRPGGPRLPDRRDAAGAPRRGVRAVRRGADGRPAARAVDRRVRRGRFGGIGFVFVFSAVTAVIAAVGIALRVREEDVERRHARPTPSPDRTEFPPDAPFLERALRAGTWRRPRPIAADRIRPATRLLNRGLIAAIVINIGGYFASGTYEVIWSLFLEGLGADLRLIGLTFAMFGLPVLLLSPYRRSHRRSARAVRVHRRRLDPAGRHRHRLHAHRGPVRWRCRSSSSRRPGSRSSTRRSTRSSRPTRRRAGRRPRRACSARPGRSGSSSRRSSPGSWPAHDILYPFYVFSAVMVVSLVLGLIDRRGSPALRGGPGIDEPGRRRGLARTSSERPTSPSASTRDPTFRFVDPAHRDPTSGATATLSSARSKS